MRKRACVVALSWLCLSVASSARADVVTLESLEKKALEKHALMRASEARERAAHADVRQAESAYMPRIALNVDANLGPGRKLLQVPYLKPDGTIATDSDGKYESATVQGTNPLGDGSPKSVFTPQLRMNANVGVSGSLYDFGRTHAAISASRAKRDAAKTDEELTRTQVIANVRGAYLNWLSAHEQYRLSHTASSDATARSQRVGALVQEGARPRGDLAPVEAERLLSELERERGEGALASATLLLGYTVGETLPPSAEPDPSVLEVQPPAAPVQRVDPSLRMLAHQRAALEATARAQRRQRAPLVTGSLAAGAIQQVDFIDMEHSTRTIPFYTAGIALVVPLWDGGSSEAAAGAAEARADELRIRLEAAEREREQALGQARLDAAHADRRRQTAQQLLEVTRTRVKDVEAGYDMGAMQFEQVQAARSMLRRAETELVLARVARAEAVLRIAP